MTLRNQKETYLSRVAARIYLPFGENLTNETGGFSSSTKTKKLNGCSVVIDKSLSMVENQSRNPLAEPARNTTPSSENIQH